MKKLPENILKKSLIHDQLCILSSCLDIRKNDYCFAGCFYFTIANLPPRLRARLNAIQAIAFAKSEHISKYGISHILKCITKDIAKLEEVSN